MPEEIVIIVVFSIFMGSVISIVKTVLGYRERRYGAAEPKKSKRSSEGASLTTTELKDMLRETVEEVTAPLSDRLAALEKTPRQLDSARLPDFESRSDVAEDIAEPVPARKQRV